MIDDETVRVAVENVTDRYGREIIQAYVSPPEIDGISRPVQELGGFATVEIPAGETNTVDVSLDDLAFRRYDEDEGWVVDAGQYNVGVGRSSHDIRFEVVTTR
ncbi:hypothetical protein GCM10009000_062330 [Halobacterium noricense]|uniref:Fibronectin type III-like domain-containing protein n=1 Tax=Haladaptatus pallidirubidus TaxID=1008152 RepID=A0AAV3UJD0_9EURY